MVVFGRKEERKRYEAKKKKIKHGGMGISGNTGTHSRTHWPALYFNERRASNIKPHQRTIKQNMHAQKMPYDTSKRLKHVKRVFTSVWKYIIHEI